MYDFIVVGGGIVGLSTANALSDQYPHAKVLVIEKESSWAEHQTGHNSGVIHSGIYYQPGSLKAVLARQGNLAMVEFCEANNIEHEVCGKVIVATDEAEVQRMEDLYERGLQNGLPVRRIDADELKEFEPHVAGLAALHVPVTGIVNYRQVCAVLAERVQARGETKLQTTVQNIVDTASGVVVETTRGTFHGKFLVNCGGLQSDRLATIAKVKTDVKIVPFRGEYYELKPEKRYLVKNLIYPVPNPAFPFLGVHFTRMIGGHVEAGPNAVLSFKREGYTKSDFDLKDFSEVMLYSGFWRMASRYWKDGLAEMVRSYSKAAFVKSLQRLVPEIKADDLEPAPAGVRAQALKPDGSMVDDFFIIRGTRTLHVCNAPSPAATASLKIGEYIVGQIEGLVEGLRIVG
ncbi:L-2-hydroxyglutarate oxidase [Alicyclobacillus sp. ALC3]|uniref:L-2-hydroxyglutarate oxidase n=1 Tax=Alicyclobacillus sp. ALC3 TaxID=2796143 RepID=UPI0023795491|nr:L-2-hydroxyglutarate oxidase [Alicyclobacillus sp. ALC3]WDL97571.1 L-2-hydroxyglutarate oxidase [Alicyclobacillus sp. ALC3]